MLENNSGDSWCVPRRTSYTFDSICDGACGSSAAGLKSGPPPRSRPKMSVQMGAAHQALCYFYRNPPASSGVKPQPYKDIAKLIQLPNTPAATIRKVVQRFQSPRQTRGRKPGWRKTTPAEDATMLARFRKIKRPLGSLVESRDVWGGVACFFARQNHRAHGGKPPSRERGSR